MKRWLQFLGRRLLVVVLQALVLFGFGLLGCTPRWLPVDAMHYAAPLVGVALGSILRPSARLQLDLALLLPLFGLCTTLVVHCKPCAGDDCPCILWLAVLGACGILAVCSAMLVLGLRSANRIRRARRARQSVAT